MTTKSNELLLMATGDIGTNRPNADSIFDGVRSTLRSADVLFGQLEPCLASVGTPAAQARLPMRGEPAGAAAIRRAGYDVISFATNHCMDWGRDAFSQTIDVLRNESIRVIGAGKCIAQARAPEIIERNGVKIGFLGYCSILPQDYFATEDRPGCAPLRGITAYVPIEHDQPGTPCRIYTFPQREDLEAMLADIRSLRPRVDVLAVSVHWGLHFVPAQLADYQRWAAHAAIDAGADLILGHHTHILKPIEVYQGKVIFYSLANFALDPPHAFDENLEARKSHQELKQLNSEWTKSKRMMPKDSYKSMIARICIREKKIDGVGFLPVLLDEGSNPHMLDPEEAGYHEVVEYMRAITADQDLDTEYEEADGFVRIRTRTEKGGFER